VIQRFEFCFELLWKTLKIYLEDRGMETRDAAAYQRPNQNRTDADL
jgi:hypothetical protein